MIKLKYSDLTDEQKEIICNGCGGKSGWLNPPELLFNASCSQMEAKMKLSALTFIVNKKKELQHGLTMRCAVY